MKPSLLARAHGERGASLVEAIVGIMLLGGVILGLASSAGMAARQTYHSKKSMQLWAAVQWAADSLRACDWDDLTAGADTVRGYPMSWVVSGTNPKRIDLEVERLNMTTSSTASDTLVLYIADQTP